MTHIRIKLGYLWGNYGITSHHAPEGSSCEITTFCQVEGVTTGSRHSSAQLRLTFKGIQKCVTCSYFCQAPHACVEYHSARIHFTWWGPACQEIST